MSTITGESWDAIVTEMHPNIFPKVFNRLLLWGVPQTGKTTTLHRLLNTTRVTYHRAMPIDDLLGGFQLIDGSTKWIDGPLVRCLRKGTILQIDEFNDLPIECVTINYAALDRPAGVTLPTGERVDAAPGYGVVCTMNPNPSCLPDPIFERFDAVFQVNTLSSGLKSALGDFAQQAERHVARQSEKLQWSRPMSIGMLLGAARLRERGVKDDTIVKALGLTDVSATDFLASITNN